MGDEPELFSNLSDFDLMRWLLADLHDDLEGKLSRFRHLADLSLALGDGGTLMPGGEIVIAAWDEARNSFIHGNYLATVLLCQSLAENMLAAHLELGLNPESLPDKVHFTETLKRCLARGFISGEDADDFRKLMSLRNPLSHYKGMGHPSNLSRRAMVSGVPAELHLKADASFAIAIAVRLLSKPPFRLSGKTILDQE